MEFAKTTAKNKGGIMATGFKETIKFNRKTIVSENSYGLVDQAKNVVGVLSPQKGINYEEGRYLNVDAKVF